MSHTNTDRLIDYWRERRGDQPAPSRASIDPGDFPDLVPQVFILGRQGAGVYPFRLSGALIEDLHHRNLRQVDFLSLWAGPDRSRMQMVMEAARRRGEVLIALAQGRSAQGHQAKLEIMLAPLSAGPGQTERFFGFYQPVSPLFRLQGLGVDRLFLLDINAAGLSPSPLLSVRLAAVDGRRIA
jgi:hypothetical protein